MKKNRFIDLTLAEICQKEIELREELATLKLKKKAGEMEKTHRFCALKRDIARLLFVKASKK